MGFLGFLVAVSIVCSIIALGTTLSVTDKIKETGLVMKRDGYWWRETEEFRPRGASYQRVYDALASGELRSIEVDLWGDKDSTVLSDERVG